MNRMQKLRSHCNDQYEQTMRRHNGLFKPTHFSNRKCQNYCFLFIFVLLMLAYIGVGVYYLTTANTILNPNYPNIIILNHPLTVIKQLLSKFWPVILAMFVLSLLLSVIFMVLAMIMPGFIFYFGIVSTGLLLGGIVGISVPAKAWVPFGLALAAIIFFMILVIFNFRHIRVGIHFLKIVNNFISERQRVIKIPLYALTMLLLFLSFWFVSLICMQYSAMTKQYTKENYVKEIVFYAFWIFMLIFFFLFMYYVKTYLIASMFSSWYYQNNVSLRSASCLLNLANIGSIAYAAATTPFVKIFQYMGPYHFENSTRCCCGKIFLLYLEFYQFLLEIINKYAVMAMALTGQSHTVAAKFAYSLLLNEYPFMYIANSMSQIIKISGIVFSAGIPTLLGYLIVQNFYNKDNTETYDKTMLLLFVFFICSILSGYYVCLYSTTLCVLCFYLCFHLKNQRQNKVIPDTNQIFDGFLSQPQIINIRAELKQKYQQADLNPEIKIFPESDRKLSP